MCIRDRCLICPKCGDGCSGPDEECDDGNSNQDDSCRTCRYPRCGDGISNQYDFDHHQETCEPSLDPDCRANCTKCGDSIVDAGEDCDGSADCAENCRIRGCGDGIIETGAGESCDPFIQVGEPGYVAGCRAVDPGECTFCGDGTVQQEAGEVCDGAEHCSANCLGFEPYCGDGIINNTEECDGDCLLYTSPSPRDS